MLNTFEESLLGNTVGEEKAMKSSRGEVSVLIDFNKGGRRSKSPDGKDIVIIKEEPLLSTTEISYMETNSRDSSPIQKNHEDHHIKSAKAKMGEVKEENERLKTLLAQIAKDYKSLQMHFFDILQEGTAKKSINTAPTPQQNEEPELVFLSLGRTSSEPKKDEKKNSELSNDKEDKESKGGLELELDCKFEPNSTEPVKNSSSENSFEDLKEEEPAEIWPPSKVLKPIRSRDEDVLQQTPLKKARVSVRARCDAHTMNDGCQWRKYGQKIAKGNPCPRAYYRCTVSPTCPVRKQVQRCMEDMSILITTYEGTHNHPLPMSATAMASTTSAAASMLLSQSSSSQPGLGSSLTAPISTSTTASLQGLNFNLFQNTRPQQFYFPNSSISTSNSHPTITLDLTAPTTTSSSPFNRFSYAPRSSSTSLNFSSSSTSSLETSWNSGNPNYGILSYNRNHSIGSLNLGRQSPQEQIYQPYMPMNNQTSSQQSLTDTIAAATKVITSDPNFRSALAAALTSFVGNGGGDGGARENHGGGESSGLSLNSAYPITQNGVACASTYLNKSSSMNFQQQQQQQKQQGRLILFPTSFPLSTSESSSGSPTENMDHIK